MLVRTTDPLSDCDALTLHRLSSSSGTTNRPAAMPMDQYPTDPDIGEVVPITLVTDNGGPFRAFRFGALLASMPELRQVRTRVRSPGQNGVRERAFQSLKYEPLYREPSTTLSAWSAMPTPTGRVKHHPTPHEALSWNRPLDADVGRADPRAPHLPRAQAPANFLTRDTRGLVVVVASRSKRSGPRFGPDRIRFCKSADAEALTEGYLASERPQRTYRARFSSRMSAYLHARSPLTTTSVGDHGYSRRHPSFSH